VEWLIAVDLARLGMVTLRQGNAKTAQAFLMEGLARARVSGNRRWSRWYLIGLAEVARLSGMVRHAATLVGVSEGVLSAPGGHYEPAMRREIERIVATIRAELDEESFARLWTEGQALPFEEAIDYALEPVPFADEGRRTKDESDTKSSLEYQQAYPDSLTEREVEVLRLIAAGKSNQEIASELVLSLRTVERHITNIYQKIGATGRVARATAATYALKHALTEG
jgi:DNA-binding CsgD family transcriptional regulator